MGHVKVSLETSKLQGAVGRGITVTTDDPERPTVMLTVRAVVLTSVTVLPQEHVLLSNRRTGGTSVERLVRQDRTESGTLVVTDLRASAPWITARAERVDAPGPGQRGMPPWQAGDWRVVVAVGDNPEYGHSRQSVTFSTALGREPEVVLPVDVDLAPPVNLPFERLELPAAGAQPVTRDFVFMIRRGLPPDELSVETEPASLHVEVERSGPRGGKATVTWDGAEAEGRIVFRVAGESFTLPVVREAR